MILIDTLRTSSGPGKAYLVDFQSESYFETNWARSRS